MLQHLWRFLIYFTAACWSNYIYPGSHYLVQGILLIAMWGNWLPTNTNWSFAQKYGKYFNWFGVFFLANGLFYFLSK